MGDSSVGSTDLQTTTHFANDSRNLYTARYSSTIDLGEVKIMPVVWLHDWKAFNQPQALPTRNASNSQN